MTLRNFGRLRVAFVMALVAMFAGAVLAVSGGSKVAGADPTANKWDKISYNISNLGTEDFHWRSRSASNYETLINQIRHISGHDFLNGVGETTNRSQRIIEIDVHDDGTPVVTLYMWADSLYVFGFYTPQGGHRWFNDAQNTAHAASILGIPEPPRLGWTGNYAQMPGGEPATRAAITYTGRSMYTDFRTLGAMRDRINGSNESRRELGQAIVRVIGSLSEAARFETIKSVIRNNLHYAGTTHLGTFNAELENSWNRISQWIYDQVNFNNPRSIIVDHETFWTLPALMRRLMFVQIRYQSGCGRNVCGG
jgi:hypothetical protein